jgi:hypothetical protein
MRFYSWLAQAWLTHTTNHANKVGSTDWHWVLAASTGTGCLQSTHSSAHAV